MAEPKRLHIEDVCEQLQIRPPTWRSYVARGQAPKPDGHEEPGPGGIAAPYWWQESIDTYRAGRRRGTNA